MLGAIAMGSPDSSLTLSRDATPFTMNLSSTGGAGSTTLRAATRIGTRYGVYWTDAGSTSRVELTADEYAALGVPSSDGQSPEPAGRPRATATWIAAAQDAFDTLDGSLGSDAGAYVAREDGSFLLGVGDGGVLGVEPSQYTGTLPSITTIAPITLADGRSAMVDNGTLTVG